MLVQGLAVAVEFLLRGGKAVLGVGDGFAFACGAGRVGQDARVDEGDAEVAELLVDPGAEGGREVVLEGVYYTVLAWRRVVHFGGW